MSKVLCEIDKLIVKTELKLERLKRFRKMIGSK